MGKKFGELPQAVPALSDIVPFEKSGATRQNYFGTIPIAGDVTGNLSATVLSNTGVTSGIYGSATQIPVYTVDSKGRITAVANTNININALLPSQTGNNGKVLGTDGTSLSWVVGGAGGSGTVTSVTGTTNRVTVTNTTTTPVIDISASYIGQTSITTLGTIATGTWNATTISPLKGGTGLTALGTANQLLRTNGAGTAMEFFTPTYISANQTITLSGAITGSGTTSITTTIGAGVVTNAMLAGSIDLTTKVTGLLPDGNISSASVWNSKESALGNPSTNGYVLSSTTTGTRSWIAMSGGSGITTLTGDVTATGTGSVVATLTPQAWTTTAYSASLTLNNNSSKERNFDITGVSGNLTIVNSNFSDGAFTSFRINKTTGSAITVTLPVGTNIQSNESECSVASNVITITSATGTKYLITIYNVASTLEATITKVNITSNFVASLGSSLTSANIFVGNGSNIATGVAVSGDLTLANTGAFTIVNNAITTVKITDSNVTYAKIQNISATSRLLGRASSGAGVIEEITIGSGLTLTGTTLSASGGGGGGIPLTGTTAGNQVTGNVKFGNGVFIGSETNSNTKFLLYDNSGEFTNGPTLTSDAGIVLNHSSNFAANRARLSLTATLVTLQQISSGVTSQVDLDSTGIAFTIGGSVRGKYTAAGNLVLGNAALATNATDGFLYLTSMAGAPSGNPTAFTGRVPFIYDTTNDLLRFYNGSWKTIGGGNSGNQRNFQTATVSSNAVTLNCANLGNSNFVIVDNTNITFTISNLNDGDECFIELKTTANSTLTFPASSEIFYNTPISGVSTALAGASSTSKYDIAVKKKGSVNKIYIQQTVS